MQQCQPASEQQWRERQWYSAVSAQSSEYYRLHYDSRTDLCYSLWVFWTCRDVKSSRICKIDCEKVIYFRQIFRDFYRDPFNLYPQTPAVLLMKQWLMKAVVIADHWRRWSSDPWRNVVKEHGPVQVSRSQLSRLRPYRHVSLPGQHLRLPQSLRYSAFCSRINVMP